MFRPLSFFIALRYSYSSTSRYSSLTFIISILSLSLGVFTMIVTMSIINALQERINERIIDTVDHITISSSKPMDDWKLMVHLLKNISGVVSITPFTKVEGMLSYKGRVVPIKVTGVDPILENSTDLSKLEFLQGNNIALDTQENSIAIDNITAGRLGLQVGASIMLITPNIISSSEKIKLKLHKVAIASVFKAEDASEVSSGLMHILDLSSIKGIAPNQVEGLSLRIENPYDASKISNVISDKIGEKYRVTSWTSVQDALITAMKTEKIMTFFFLFLVIFVGVFNIMATLSLVVSSKLSDIAMLRTMGASSWSIMLVFILQGSITGFLGTLIGSGLGIITVLHLKGFIQLMDRVLHRDILYFYNNFADSFPSGVEYDEVIYICIFSLLLSFLSALYPAYRASKIYPSISLSHSYFL